MIKPFRVWFAERHGMAFDSQSDTRTIERSQKAIADYLEQLHAELTQPADTEQVFEDMLGVFNVDGKTN